MARISSKYAKSVALNFATSKRDRAFFCEFEIAKIRPFKNQGDRIEKNIQTLKKSYCLIKTYDLYLTYY